MQFSTADLCDAHGDDVQVAEPIFRLYGGLDSFAGPAMTLKVFEDNSLVRQALEGPGEGRVLVVDGGGSLRCALVGDVLGQLAIDNHWAGLVVYGCIRDAAELAGMAIGIRAIQTHPRKSHKRGIGDSGMTVRFAGVTVRSGDWIYVDEDGIVISAQPVHGEDSA